MFDRNHFQGLNATELPEFEEAVSKYKEPGQLGEDDETNMRISAENGIAG